MDSLVSIKKFALEVILCSYTTNLVVVRVWKWRSADPLKDMQTLFCKL